MAQNSGAVRSYCGLFWPHDFKNLINVCRQIRVQNYTGRKIFKQDWCKIQEPSDQLHDVREPLDPGRQ